MSKVVKIGIPVGCSALGMRMVSVVCDELNRRRRHGMTFGVYGDDNGGIQVIGNRNGWNFDVRFRPRDEESTRMLAREAFRNLKQRHDERDAECRQASDQ